MAQPTNLRNPTKETHRTKRSQPPQRRETQKEKEKPQQQQQQQLPSWAVMKNILTCKHMEVSQQHHQQTPQKKKKKSSIMMEENNREKNKKMRCSGSLCNNTKITQRPELTITNTSPDTTTLRRKSSRRIPLSSSSNSTSSHEEVAAAGSSRSLKVSIFGDNTQNRHNTNNRVGTKGMPFRRLSGCYECRMVVDPVLAFAKDPSLRATICSCPDCGEVFLKPENLELHQSVRHAVSELGPEDTSKNIVEIIFQSSWLRKQTPVCQIDRILKVHNTQRTINKFEEYRDSIKLTATKFPKKYSRCMADGNELLRFHSTTFTCSLGLNGSSNLCNSIPYCNVCSIIKNGFKVSGHGPTLKGILTTAASGRAHDRGEVGSGEHERRAMLVCRVIAGRVKKSQETTSESEEYDSMAGATGVYSNLEELYVINPKAILPCFVVIYREF